MMEASAEADVESIQEQQQADELTDREVLMTKLEDADTETYRTWFFRYLENGGVPTKFSSGTYSERKAYWLTDDAVIPELTGSKHVHIFVPEHMTIEGAVRGHNRVFKMSGESEQSAPWDYAPMYAALVDEAVARYPEKVLAMDDVDTWKRVVSEDSEWTSGVTKDARKLEVIAEHHESETGESTREQTVMVHTDPGVGVNPEPEHTVFATFNEETGEWEP